MGLVNKHGLKKFSTLVKYPPVAIRVRILLHDPNVAFSAFAQGPDTDF